MASPIPNFSADTAQLASQLDASAIGSTSTLSYGPDAQVFRYEGTTLGFAATPNEAGGYISSAVPAPYGFVYRVAFTCDCQKFEFAIQSRQGGNYRLSVDGVYTSADPVIADNHYPARDFVLVTFPDKRPRQIKLWVQGNAPFFGVNTVSGDTLSPPQVAIGPRMFIFGDSWTGPTIVQPLQSPSQPGEFGGGYPEALGEFFNWDWWDDGIGGTGFTNTGTDADKRTFVQRVETDVCPNTPKGILILGGTNDGAASETEMQSAVSATLSELQTCLPGAPIYLYGPQFEQAPLDQAMAAAVASSTASVSYTDLGEQNWLYGSETDPSTGNEYLYFNAHPTPLGHDYVAEYIVRDLVTKFPNLMPQPYTLFAPAPVAGVFTYSVASGTLLPVGENPVSVSFAPTDAAHYQTATTTANITVVKATTSTSLKVAQNNGTLTVQLIVAPQIAGTPTGTVSILANGNAVGSLTLSSGAGNGTFPSSALPTGNDVLTASYSGDGNFEPSTTASSVTIANVMPDFTFGLQQQQVTLLPSSTVDVPLTITPSGGLSATLSVTCSGLPANASCSLMNGPVPVNGQPAKATIVIQSFAQQAALQPGSNSGFPGRVPETVLSGFAVVLFTRRRFRHKGVLAAALVAGGMMLGLSGCGSSATMTNAAPGTYTAQVTLTSASNGSVAAISHSQSITVVIP